MRLSAGRGPPSAYLGVSVDGGVVEGRVVVESVGVAVSAGTQQLARHVHSSVIACLVQRRPTYTHIISQPR